MIRSRPVMERIRWMASMVASVPELAKRQLGRPNRAASSVATVTASGVGWAKWVPLAACSLMAWAMAGWAGPAGSMARGDVTVGCSVTGRSRALRPPQQHGIDVGVVQPKVEVPYPGQTGHETRHFAAS